MPLQVPIDKQIHQAKFEVEENTKLHIARKLPLQPQFFQVLNDWQDKISLKKIEENQS